MAVAEEAGYALALFEVAEVKEPEGNRKQHR